jgi:hypothetical protein
MSRTIEEISRDFDRLRRELDEAKRTSVSESSRSQRVKLEESDHELHARTEARLRKLTGARQEPKEKSRSEQLAELRKSNPLAWRFAKMVPNAPIEAALGFAESARKPKSRWP